MTKESPKQDIETGELRLAKALELVNRSNNSKWRPIWQGVLWGIGSTIGLAVALYAISLLTKPLQFVPIIGTFIREQIQPIIDQKTSTPTSTNTTTPSTTTPTTQSTSTSTSKSSISNNYLSIILPGNWSIKVNQTSSGNKLLNFEATTDQDASFQVEVTKQAANTNEQTLLSSDTVTVDSVKGTQRRYKTSANGANETIDLNLIKNNLYYSLSLDYNPEFFNGQTTFTQILNSFQFHN
jgi:hypothetical protein